MRVFALTILFLMLALIAFGGSSSKMQVGRASPEVHDYRYAEAFRGTEVGNTLARACGNCHSNHTVLPWYGHIAPVSWWLESHVREGREALNFSDWTRYTAGVRRNQLELICGVISSGRMPPTSYAALHSEARLTAQDRKAICAWVAAEIEREK